MIKVSRSHLIIHLSSTIPIYAKPV